MSLQDFSSKNNDEYASNGESDNVMPCNTPCHTSGWPFPHHKYIHLISLCLCIFGNLLLCGITYVSYVVTIQLTWSGSMTTPWIMCGESHNQSMCLHNKEGQAPHPQLIWCSKGDTQMRAMAVPDLSTCTHSCTLDILSITFMLVHITTRHKSTMERSTQSGGQACAAFELPCA